jgi:hypothetical protein
MGINIDNLSLAEFLPLDRYIALIISKMLTTQVILIV